MLESLGRALAIPELKARIQFVLVMFAVFVLGAHIPTPGIDHNAMARIMGQQGNNGLLGLVDVFSGGALRRMSIFAMGIGPYINASIIMQMMTIAIPSLEHMQKEGETGRKQIAKITRYLTVGLAFVQAFGMIQIFRSQGAVNFNLFQSLQAAIILTAGTSFLLWMGEQITEKGVGNGVSMVIFAGIITSLPYYMGQTIMQVNTLIGPFNLVVLAALFVGTTYAIVMFTQAQRKVPIQHAKRVIGMKQVGGGATYLPIKILTAGVIPIIFAVSLMLLPATLTAAIPGNTGFLGWIKQASQNLSPGANPLASAFYFLLVVGFTYFYTAIVMNVQDMADNLKKYGNFIPGIRPGKPTFDYLDRVVTRITAAGAVFLATIALLQYYTPQITGIRTFPLVGGTSLLIIVGVAIEAMQSIEAQMLMRNYEGFIRQ